MKDTSRMYHKIVDEILDLVDTDNFSVGSRLPSERELALKFGVSRACIREAQIVLEAQGHLKVKAGSGAYVFNKNDPKSSCLPNPECFELIEAHGLFGGEVAALAALLITDDAIKQLEKLASIIVGKISSEMTPDEAVVAFYNLIAKATNNRAIIFLIENMWVIKPEVNQTRPTRSRVHSRVSAYLEDEHKTIIAALKKRDPIKAREATQECFSRIMKVLLEASELDAYQEMKRKMSETRSRFLLSSHLS